MVACCNTSGFRGRGHNAYPVLYQWFAYCTFGRRYNTAASPGHCPASTNCCSQRCVLLRNVAAVVMRAPRTHMRFKRFPGCHLHEACFLLEGMGPQDGKQAKVRFGFSLITFRPALLSSLVCRGAWHHELQNRPYRFKACLCHADCTLGEGIFTHNGVVRHVRRNPLIRYTEQ